MISRHFLRYLRQIKLQCHKSFRQILNICLYIKNLLRCLREYIDVCMRACADTDILYGETIMRIKITWHTQFLHQGLLHYTENIWVGRACLCVDVHACICVRRVCLNESVTRIKFGFNIKQDCQGGGWCRITWPHSFMHGNA